MVHFINVINNFDQNKKKNCAVYGKTISKSAIYKFFIMSELFDSGKIHYQLHVALEELNIKRQQDATCYLYAFEFDKSGKRGLFVANNDLICRLLMQTKIADNSRFLRALFGYR